MSGAGWAAIAGAANAYAGQRQQQDEEARWEQRYQIMQKQQAAAEEARARFLATLRPPESRTLNTTGADGKPMVQQQEWTLPVGDQPGSWKNVGDAKPDINFERLAETQKNNEERNRLASERDAANIDMARERLAAQQARGEASAATRDKGFSFDDYANASPQQRALYDRYRRGEEDPSAKADFKAREMTGKELGEMSRLPTESERANTLYRNQTLMGADPFASVKAGAESNAPMGQFDGGGQAPAKGHGRVVRTGTKNGRRVVQYEDGTIDYAQ